MREILADISEILESIPKEDDEFMEYFYFFKLKETELSKQTKLVKQLTPSEIQSKARLYQKNWRKIRKK